ncbi:3'(2'),5'-bisphosphate nucleotidase CysQ [Rhodobacter calidifons]|uniref:3'(2'),5'-bisphosphate nucleotidase CysQ n=1 Tax=Rhodobacter calidifons TaxID=2715277 RepID=A0ABX0G413_9RHOB|nr:3'(2'),5'-bisphosphate nucleotidase CysQ [Rhodobacter calidifons]NHB75712.1 3'(2'),5'-bisphosphate nucleotidase CysQ [Rhodobacter calidifons]
MPARDLALLTEAAREAGRIALRYWRKDPKVWDKGGEHGPVTEADLAVNDMLKARLLEARPGYGWLSEETPDSPDRLTAEAVFILDPIDGTRAFIAGEETWAHSLAVAREGRITAGVVYLPALDRIYTASETSPAMRDGELIAVSGRDRLEGANILTTKANMAPEKWPGGVPEITRSFRASLAYRMCLAAEGRFDGMLTLRDAWEWDIAAGALIAERAGAVVTDMTGAPLRFNAAGARAQGVLALPPGPHAEALARLQG